jgi:hypothetical protein
VFWIPLTPGADKPITAKPVVPAPASVGASQVMPLKLDFSRGGDRPEGWNTPWIGAGKVTAARDPQVQHDGKPSLRLQAAAPESYGTVGQTISGNTPFTISGFGKVEGQIAECLVAVQCFDASGKQVAWLHLAHAKAWQSFTADVSLGANVKSANLVFTIRGSGNVWLSDLRTAPIQSVFR